MSKYADEGSIAHALAAMCLEAGTNADAYIGRVIECVDGEHHDLSPSAAVRWMSCPGSTVLTKSKPSTAGRKFSAPVTEEMAADVQTYLDNLRDYLRSAGATLMVEQRVDCGRWTGIAGHGGTADAIVVVGTELQVHDLKFGRGVEVDAEENSQLMLYALGALDMVEALGETVERVRLVIHQPRITKAPSEWDCSVAWLADFGERARAAVGGVRSAKEVAGPHDPTWRAAYLSPSEPACRWCDAKATCPALAERVQKEVGDDFENLDADKLKRSADFSGPSALAVKLRAVPLIEAWCTALAAHAEALALAGEKVPGFKLVAGRKGSRKWTSAEEAEARMKAFRMKHDEMYDYSIISPTTAEKRLAKEHPRQWSKLTDLVTQSDAKPTLVPESDKRPAIEVKPVTDGFQALAAEEV